MCEVALHGVCAFSIMADQELRMAEQQLFLLGQIIQALFKCNFILWE